MRKNTAHSINQNEDSLDDSKVAAAKFAPDLIPLLDIRLGCGWVVAAVGLRECAKARAWHFEAL